MIHHNITKVSRKYAESYFLFICLRKKGTPQVLAVELRQHRLQEPKAVCSEVAASEVELSDAAAAVQTVLQHPAVPPLQGTVLQVDLSDALHGSLQKLFLVELVETVQEKQGF